MARWGRCIRSEEVENYVGYKDVNELVKFIEQDNGGPAGGKKLNHTTAAPLPTTIDTITTSVKTSEKNAKKRRNKKHRPSVGNKVIEGHSGREQSESVCALSGKEEEEAVEEDLPSVQLKQEEKDIKLENHHVVHSIGKVRINSLHENDKIHEDKSVKNNKKKMGSVTVKTPASVQVNNNKKTDKAKNAAGEEELVTGATNNVKHNNNKNSKVKGEVSPVETLEGEGQTKSYNVKVVPSKAPAACAVTVNMKNNVVFPKEYYDGYSFPDLDLPAAEPEFTVVGEKKERPVTKPYSINHRFTNVHATPRLVRPRKSPVASPSACFMSEDPLVVVVPSASEPVCMCSTVMFGDVIMASILPSYKWTNSLLFSTTVHKTVLPGDVITPPSVDCAAPLAVEAVNGIPGQCVPPLKEPSPECGGQQTTKSLVPPTKHHNGNERKFHKNKSVIFLDKRLNQVPKNLGITFGFEQAIDTDSIGSYPELCSVVVDDTSIASTSSPSATSVLSHQSSHSDSDVPSVNTNSVITSHQHSQSKTSSEMYLCRMACVVEGMAGTELEEELSCPICLELYEDPVILPCQHNFCRECLNAHIQRHKATEQGTHFPCPSCRGDVKLKSITRLPKNFALANIISKFQSLKHECTEIEPGPRHEQEGGECKAHRRPLTVFCNTCDSVLCTKCLADHSGHHTLDLEDKVILCKNEVKQSVLPKITELKNCLASTQQDLIARQNSVEEEIRNDWQEVMDTFSTLRLVLDQKELELSSNLQARKEDIHSYIKTEIQKIDNQQNSLKQLESRVLTVVQQYPVLDTLDYPDFSQYRKLHEDTAQLEFELNKTRGPSHKDVPRTVCSKQGICDTLWRMAADLDKMDLSFSKQADNPVDLESAVEGLDVHTKSKMTPDMKRNSQYSTILTSNSSDPVKPKTPDPSVNYVADWSPRQTEDTENPIPRHEPTVRPTDKKTQRGFIKKMLSKSLKKHSEVYIVSKSWIGKCQTFLNKKEGSGIHPGPVDNSSIMETDDSLSANLLEGYDFVAINESVWSRIVEWYGLKDGQTPIKRKVISEGLLTGTLSVEIYPMKVVLTCAGQRSCQCYSKSDSLGFLKQEFHRIFKLFDEKDLQMKIKVGGTNTNCWIYLSSQADTCSLKDAGITQATEIHCDVV